MGLLPVRWYSARSFWGKPCQSLEVKWFTQSKWIFILVVVPTFFSLLPKWAKPSKRAGRWFTTDRSGPQHDNFKSCLALYAVDFLQWWGMGSSEVPNRFFWLDSSYCSSFDGSRWRRRMVVQMAAGFLVILLRNNAVNCLLFQVNLALLCYSCQCIVHPHQKCIALGIFQSFSKCEEALFLETFTYLVSHTEGIKTERMLLWGNY